MKEQENNQYIPNEFITKYLDYLKYERKLSNNTILSYQNDLKSFDKYFKSQITKIKLLIWTKDNIVSFWYNLLISTKSTLSYAANATKDMKKKYKTLKNK